MNVPFGSMMTSMGMEWSIISLVVLILATGALVVLTHRNRSLDGQPGTG